MNFQRIRLIVLNTITGAGGHFIFGNRATGYLFLLSLIFLPLASTLIVVFAILVFKLPENIATVLAQLIFITGLTITLYLSSQILLRSIQSNNNAFITNAKPRWFVIETIVVCIIGVVVLLLSLTKIVLVPDAGWLLGGESRATVLTFKWPWSSTQYHNVYDQRELPSTPGDLKVIGLVTRNGKILTKTHLVLLFRGGYRTKDLLTDENGYFTTFLPSGDWYYQGQIIHGLEDQWISVEFSDARPDGEIFHVNPAGNERIVHMQLDVNNTASSSTQSQ